MRPARTFTGFLRKGFPPPFAKFTLETNDTIRNELFASFELYSEVKTYGKDILKAQGHTNLASAFKRFQSYIRQARVFYDGAEALHYRASPLLYYYSFMNFAKAFAFLRDPAFSDSQLMHGLSHTPKKGALKNQTVLTKQSGVFPLFYKNCTGVTMQNNARISIRTALSYVQDVSYEYQTLKIGQTRSFRGNLAVAHDAQTRNSHTLLAFPAYESPKNFQKLSQKLSKHFDEVDLSKDAAKYVFDIPTEAKRGYKFLESKKQYPNNGNSLPLVKIIGDTSTALDDLLSYCPFNTDVLFCANLPIPTPKLRPFNEFLAVYCVMFYLGSLVRYRPQFLESLLETKDAWIIERFIKQTPITFLRHMRNAIDGKYIALSSR